MNAENGAKLQLTPLFKRQDFHEFSMVCPPDKSITHRSVMFAAMAKGASRVHRPLLGEDCVSTINVFRSLGVSITIVKKASTGDGGFLSIESAGWDGWQSPRDSLDFGNSGTTARLLLGVFAATPDLVVTCRGDASLSKRPMARVVEPLRAMGAQIDGEDGGNLLPITVNGQQLTSIDHRFEKSSAQVKSCLLLAGLNVPGPTRISLPSGSRDHTEKFLAKLGAEVAVAQDKGEESVLVNGPFRPKALDLKVPGDPSSAAFFVVLGALAPEGFTLTIKDVLVNPTRTGFLAATKQAGVVMHRIDKKESDGFIEPVCDLQITGGQPLQPMRITSQMVPTLIDEVPILAILALFCEGVSTFEGLGELRVKESDRLAKTQELLQLAGGRVEVQNDTLVVHGDPTFRPKGFVFDPAHDHRLAMAAAVLAGFSDEAVELSDPRCVDVSFPGFYELLDQLR